LVTRLTLSPASERLSEAETSAASEQYRAQQNADAPNAFHSEIYTPGTEYVLCQAIAQLLSAVVGVLNESLTESVKAFYRLRKAYIALDTILKMEEKFMEAHRLKQGISTRPSDLSKSSANSDEKLAEKSSMDSSIKGPSTVNGLPTLDTDLVRKVSGLSIAQENSSEPVSRTSTPGGSNITHDPDSDIFKNEIDIFIHSGANFCFGILLILISMIPPSFSKLLSIIGFHGDKQRGLRMVWQASKFHNLIGAFAALAVLGYYNGFVRYCDIMPDPTPGEDDVEGYPAEKLVTLLAEMRSRFPDSRLWLLEESRMEGANKNLDGAMELLANSKKSPLKQVEALCVFEKSLNALFLHDYSACTSAFIEVIRAQESCTVCSHILTLPPFSSAPTSTPGPDHCITTLLDHAKSFSTANAARLIPKKPRNTPKMRSNIFAKRHRMQARRSLWPASYRSTFLFRVRSPSGRPGRRNGVFPWSMLLEWIPSRK
jgi:hypothetical protein